jgi:hypothetical protein
VFGSVVAGAFQITFRAKMHANDVFSFFKNHFLHQHIKTIQNVQTILNFSKKKKIKIFWERSRSRVPKRSLNIHGQEEIIHRYKNDLGRRTYIRICTNHGGVDSQNCFQNQKLQSTVFIKHI